MKEGEGGSHGKSSVVLLGAVVGSVSHELVASGASRSRSTTRLVRFGVCNLVSPCLQDVHWIHSCE